MLGGVDGWQTLPVTLTPRQLATIPGWFPALDQLLFNWFLGEQARQKMTGDIAELGVYMGRSATLMGSYMRPGERFTVVDLFDSRAWDEANRHENETLYQDLTQAAFETHYRRFHNDLPTVVRGLSSDIVGHCRVNAHRFVHVDASHLYEHVRTDIASAKTLLQLQGIAVFDDIRSAHTPGVAAAVWNSVVNDGLKPIVISRGKLYGTWGDPAPWQAALQCWFASANLDSEVQQVAGGPLIRVWEGPRDRPVLRALLGMLPAPVRSRVKASYRRREDGRAGTS